MWVQLSTNKTLLSVDKRGWTFKTYIAEVHAANVTLSIDGIELVMWAVNNKFVRCWYCQDLCNCSVLKVAIKKTIHKSPHDVQQRHLFCDKDDGQQIQFLGLWHHSGLAMWWILSAFTELLSFILISTSAQLSCAV